KVSMRSRHIAQWTKRLRLGTHATPMGVVEAGMGTSVTLLSKIFKKCFGPSLTESYSYLDIGSQHLFGGSPQDYREFIVYCLGESALTSRHEEACRDLAERSHGAHPRQCFCAELFSVMGWDYHSVDMYYATTIADLNTFKLDEKYQNRFDMVANFGTTEHVFD